MSKTKQQGRPLPNNKPAAGAKPAVTALFSFEKINYQLFIASIAVVCTGFVLMMGTEDIYSFAKITMAPLLVVVGFALGFLAILYKPKAKKTATK